MKKRSTVRKGICVRTSRYAVLLSIAMTAAQPVGAINNPTLAPALSAAGLIILSQREPGTGRRVPDLRSAGLVD